MTRRIDITGQKFDQLTVVSYAETRNKKAYWNCVCTCGRTKKVRGDELKSGLVKTCGQCPKYEDLTGMVFGNLKVIEYAGTNNSNHTLGRCLCKCGKEIVTRADVLKSGLSKSCGCKNKELHIEWGKEAKIHGESNSRLYNIWKLIKQRCSNPKASSYKYYGEKGIEICEEWKCDFEKFYIWSMNNGYEDTLTIDRIDSKGNYEPNNCRWITRSENSRRVALELAKKRRKNKYKDITDED